MDQAEPLVVIVVLNWNGREDCRECLESLRSLTYPNFRTLLVDNASTDDSVPFVREHFGEVEVIENAQNLGFTEGNNVGMRRALEMDAGWVLLLNNDTTVEPDFVTKLVAAAQTDATIGVIGPRVNLYNPCDRIWFAGGHVTMLLGWTWHIGNHRTDGGQYTGCIDQDFQTGAAMMLSREVLTRVGLLDNGFFIYFEDTDLSLRAKAAGYRCVCCRDALIYHKVSMSTGGGLTPGKAYRKILSGARFFRRHAGKLRYYTTVAAFNFTYAGVTGLFKLVTGKPGVTMAILCGFWDLFRGRDRGVYGNS